MTLAKAVAGVVRAGCGINNIGFNDGDKMRFDAYDLPELLECWIGFCAENGFQANHIAYVERG